MDSVTAVMNVRTMTIVKTVGKDVCQTDTTIVMSAAFANCAWTCVKTVTGTASNVLPMWDFTVRNAAPVVKQ